jgi:hypothetical protein
MQTTKNIFLVRPASFYFNNETAGSNAFQNKTIENESRIKQKAFSEFDRFANTLKSKGVNVIIFEDTENPKKPDAVFPNNWVSLHADGTMVLYPMCAPNRRLERRQDIIDSLKKKFKINKTIDLSVYEKENKFLEGTGSIVFDHNNKIAYACLSIRTNKELFINLCDNLQYQPICFFAHDQNKNEIYHTNVMMCIAEKFAVVCLSSITEVQERKEVINSLVLTGHEIIDISFEQMNHFAGNMLALHTKENREILVLSQSAYESLSQSQKNIIEKYSEATPMNITTIETIGGGSARCMIAEVFLPLN